MTTAGWVALLALISAAITIHAIKTNRRINEILAELDYQLDEDKD